MLILSELEKRCLSDRAGVICEAEDGYTAKVEALSAAVTADPRKRLVLLAGPSSSGKTTTANLLCDRLRAAGHPTFVVSLDDFYRPLDDEDYPRQENGELDYETVDALRIGEIRACLETIGEGRPYWLPRFDFRTHTRIEHATLLSVPRGGYVIFEGLHALNPALTEGVAPDYLFRVYISVAEEIGDDAGARLLSGDQLRFLRRVSRDALYRSSGAAHTYSLWQNVLAGEAVYLDPYRETADCRFCTFHAYEIGALKPYAERLLSAPDAPHDAYTDAIRAVIAAVSTIPTDAVPPSSLLREFIPGGVYEELY